MWISKRRLEEIKKASYDAGLNKGYKLGLEYRPNRLAQMTAVEEAERILNGGE